MIIANLNLLEGQEEKGRIGDNHKRRQPSSNPHPILGLSVNLKNQRRQIAFQAELDSPPLVHVGTGACFQTSVAFTAMKLRGLCSEDYYRSQDFSPLHPAEG